MIARQGIRQPAGMILILLVLLPGGIWSHASGEEDLGTLVVPEYIKRWGSQDSRIIDFVYYFPEAPMDITTALKLWQPVMEEYKKYLHFPRPLRTRFFVNRQELERVFQSEPVALAFLPLDYYLENKERLRIRPYSTFRISKETKYTLNLLVHSDFSAQSLAEMKGTKLAVTRTADNQPLFLSRIVFRGKIDVTTFFGEILYPQDSYSTLQSIRINMVDAVLIPSYYMKILDELDPSFKKQFRTVFTSAPIPAPPFVCFEDNITEEDLKVFVDVTLKVTELPAVKQALMFLMLEGVEAVSEADYREVEQLWKAGQKQHHK